MGYSWSKMLELRQHRSFAFVRLVPPFQAILTRYSIDRVTDIHKCLICMRGMAMEAPADGA